MIDRDLYDAVLVRLEALESKISDPSFLDTSLKDRMDLLEASFLAMENSVDAIEGSMSLLENRVSTLEQGGGNVVLPTLIPRGSGKAPILQVGIGGYVLARCSSYYKRLFSNQDGANVGDIFTITEEMANSGNTVYIPGNHNGVYVDPSQCSNGLKTKANLGAGTYMVIHGGSFTEENDSVITCVRIA